ncbi:MAG: sigma-70 family RNA polymerase sigma factor [Gemmatimonadetes bacterium]|nr:sigma-70 family RNA polymerase sigma factor [Gemmatimonadota bacterium]MYH51929.1 sigma-70 family RNA polymerase sigma factor [Gemmatimonadota bacterium]MYK66139.1 sigma-70 family RNA polymerase sigma factor [Gemmatimonadota bacterium]
MVAVERFGAHSHLNRNRAPGGKGVAEVSQPPDQQSDSSARPNSGLIGQWAREHRHAMLREAGNWAGDAVTAEDIVQDALWIAHREAGQLKDAGKTRSWLIGIVRRIGRRGAGKRARRACLLQKRQVDVEAWLMLETDSDSRRDEVLALADSLPSRQREIIRLVVLEQMRGAEIAERLETTGAAIRQSRRRAILRLKAMVQGGSTP